jgi:hypothetical protein
MSTALVRSILGLSCNSDTPDSDGVVWTCSRVEGWDAAEIRQSSLTPTGRHGIALGAAFRGGRPLRATGLALAPNQTAAWAAYNRLAAILDVNQTGQLITYEPTPKQITVALSDKPLISSPLNGHFTWDLSLIAPVPFKTATTSTTTTLAGGATTTIANAGTSAAYPVVTVTSSGTVDLVIGGRHFTTSSLASGVYIDMWARTIRTSSGVDVTPWPKVPATEWLAIPPGSQSVQQAGTAALSIVTSDTYA